MQTLAITGNHITRFPFKTPQMKLHLKASLAFALAGFGGEAVAQPPYSGM